MSKNLIFCWITGFLLVSTSIHAQQDTLKVLFVGNSYTYGYNLPHIVSIISEGTGTLLATRKSTIGGATLREHWYGQRGLQTRQIIAEGAFDAVVLQDHSLSAINHPDSTLKYVKLFAGYNLGHGAKTYLYNTWPRERVPQFRAEINAMYEKAAGNSGAARVPAGDAWALALDVRPGVDLYTSDGSHPNELGTLLTATVFVKTICGELPEKMPTLYMIHDPDGETVRLMNHHWEDAEFCRRIAEGLFIKETSDH
jgi:hypothetical protein